MSKTDTTILTIALLLYCGAAYAGGISKYGSSIEVETYRCTVVSPRSIHCINVGRVCEEDRARQKKQDDYYFGCALDDWKAKHPKEDCLPFEKTYFAPQECTPMALGGF